MGQTMVGGQSPDDEKPSAAWWVVAAGALALVLGFVVLAGSGTADDPPPDQTAATTTAQGGPTTDNTAEPSATSTSTTALPRRLLTIEELEMVLKALPPGAPFWEDSCRATDAVEHQTGEGDELSSPAVTPTVICPAVVELPPGLPGLDATLPDRLLAVAVLHAEPPSADQGVTLQPGLAFDRPGVADRPAADTGEGLDRVPIDLVAWYLPRTPGWGTAQVLDPAGDFTAIPGATWWVHTSPDSPVQIFLTPTDGLTPDTVLYWQSFGRRASGPLATRTDPAVSQRIDLGPLGACVTEGGTCAPPPGPRRFDLSIDPPAQIASREPYNGIWTIVQDETHLRVKVIDGCDVNDRYWVFASGAFTSPRATITITDVERDGSVDIELEAGWSGPILDTDAFATCP